MCWGGGGLIQHRARVLCAESRVLSALYLGVTPRVRVTVVVTPAAPHSVAVHLVHCEQDATEGNAAG